MHIYDTIRCNRIIQDKTREDRATWVKVGQVRTRHDKITCYRIIYAKEAKTGYYRGREGRQGR